MKLYNLILAFFVFNCLTAQVENKTIAHDGNDREYIIYTPTNYDGSEPLPLLLCFHGFTSTANLLMAYSRFNALAESENFIAVYPQGLLFGGSTHWNVGGFTLGSNVDDVGFVNVLLDELTTNYNIDGTRVYSTGMSNGGYMSFLLACQLSDRITAVASVTGSMTPQTYDACNPQRVVPVLQIHGNADGTVPYNGAFWSKSIDDVLDYWSTHNSCEAEADVYIINDVDQTDGSTVEQFVFDQGDNCSSVIHFKVDGGGHDWPGVWGNMDMDASTEVWNFVSQYDMNGLIGCTTSLTSFENSKIKIYPNPSIDFINVESEKNITSEYRIINARNEVVKHGVIASHEDKILMRDLNAGIYFLLIDNEVHKLIKI
ncbi:MAG: T9SS type A sorting domain-containing protein [Bacteroidia bacterium]|nr:T9SS type A sorting domain-containing protein [Bacteroidia bacterium]